MVPVKPHIAKRSHIRSMEEYERLHRRSLDRPEEFWCAQAERISRFRPPPPSVGESLIATHRGS
jgi:hypothetical protein